MLMYGISGVEHIVKEKRSGEVHPGVSVSMLLETIVHDAPAGVGVQAI